MAAGAILDPKTYTPKRCGFRFRFKLCHACGAENDVTAQSCEKCDTALVDADTKLKQAKLSKNAHVLIPDRIELNEKTDKFVKTFTNNKPGL